MQSDPRPDINVTEVIERMKDALEITNDTELAKFLNVSNKTVSSWKTRGSIPIEEILAVNHASGRSVDYLLLGKEISRELGGNDIDQDIMRIIGEHLFVDILEKYARAELAYMTEDDIADTGKVIGALMHLQYQTIEKDKRALVDEGGLSIDKFIEYERKRDRIDLPYFAKAMRMRNGLRKRS